MSMNPKLQNLHETFCRKQILNGCTPRTIKWYRNSFIYYCKATKTKKIQDITSDQLEIFFFEGRAMRQWQDSTYMSYYRAIKSFLSWCTSEGLFETNPISKVDKPRKKNQHVPDYFREKSIRHILAAVQGNYQNDRFLLTRNYAIISTLIHSGIRKSELLKLKLRDVNFERKHLSIKQSKWNKDREVSIPENLILALKRYIVERNRKKSDSNYLFISHSKHKITESALNHFFKNLSKIVGFKVSSHRFRHTYATMLIRSGLDIKRAAKLLGHSNEGTTLMYVHISDEDLVEAVEKHLPKFY